MMKHEFVDLVTAKFGEAKKLSFTISDEDYDIIEQVYMYHPAIKDKKNMAQLFNEYGMTIIADMLPRSQKIAALEERKQALMLEAEGISKEISELFNK